MARNLVPIIFDAALPVHRGGGDPFTQLHREMNRLFDDALRGGAPPAGTKAAAPRMNVSETDGEVHIDVELPGIPEADVQVELAEDMLTIRGEKKSERQDAQHHVAERAFGTFARAIRLPFAPKPEQVQAKFEHGVLHITLPKSAPQPRSYRIPLQAGGAKPQGSDDAKDSATAGHPTEETTLQKPPAPNPTYVDNPPKGGVEAEEAHEEGPGHAT